MTIERRQRTQATPIVVESAVATMLTNLGFSPDTDEGLRDTPKRVAKAYAELLKGYEQTASEVLATKFDAHGYDQVVVLKDIDFASLCEHHLLPFTGKVSIAYLPGEKVVGLSKLARLVDMHARRLQIQECMTRDIVDDIARELGSKGVAVIVRATHTCMTIRGAMKPGAVMETSALHGVFMNEASARAEVMELLKP